MKIEVGKFYMHKENGAKLICIDKPGGCSLFWNYKEAEHDWYESDCIEEWREPITKELWIYLGGYEENWECRSKPLNSPKEQGWIGARKVTLVEGEWE